MVLAALARLGRLGRTDLKGSQYEVLRLWQEMYGEAMRVMLPDTYQPVEEIGLQPKWSGSMLRANAAV